MKYLTYLLAAAMCLGFVAGCGGEDRSALAKQTVQTYWDDIGQGKLTNAYYLMTSGNRDARSLQTYTRDMYQFLISTAGISGKAGTPSVSGDTAVVPVTLSSPKTSGKLHAYQHLFWENGHWRIADQNGGLSQKK